MADIQQVITTQGLASSKTIQVAFILILVGVWIKMAFFPLSGWLPNVYSYAPSTTACLLAPLVTKVSIYVMIRMMLTVFGPEFVFNSRDGSEVIVWLAVVAIISASVLALRQTELKRMLSYLILAEVGYMVGGAWLANHYGMVGAIYHILSDGFMTLALFLASGIFFHATGSHSIAALKGIHEKMPWTMAAFTVAALSMIGVPPTCGFFSKFYLIRGGIESGHWEYVVALLFSSLINAILFFRIIESAYFNILPAGEANEEDPHSLIEPEFEKAPGSMLIPLIITAGLLLAIGLFNQDIVDLIQDGLQPYAIVGGRN